MGKTALILDLSPDDRDGSNILSVEEIIVLVVPFWNIFKPKYCWIVAQDPLIYPLALLDTALREKLPDIKICLETSGAYSLDISSFYHLAISLTMENLPLVENIQKANEFFIKTTNQREVDYWNKYIDKENMPIDKAVWISMEFAEV